MRHKVAESETITEHIADLRAFCLAADLGAITAAARAMGETKGALSRRVGRLERALGVALLRRGARSVSMTDDGAAFRERVGAALEALDEGAAAVRAGRAEPRGVLRVTGPTDLGGILAPLVSGFLTAYPAVRVEVELTQTALDFEANRIDVAFRAAATLRDSSLIAHRMMDLELGFFAAPSYLCRNAAPTHPSELGASPLLAMRFKFRELSLTLRRGEAEERVPLRAAMLANDNGFVRDATVAGGGVGVLLKDLAARDVAEGRLVPVLEEWSAVERGTLYLLHSGAALLPPKVRAFRDYAKGALRVSR